MIVIECTCGSARVVGVFVIALVGIISGSAQTIVRC